MLAVPASLYGQSYGWPAAFVNYEVPVPLFLVYFIWTEELYRKKAEKYSCFQTFAVIPLGICVQLFSENITIIVAAYALWMLVYTAVRYRKIYLIEVNYLCSAILGAVLMFSNSAYSSAAVHNGKTYKSIDMSAGILLQRFAARIWTNLVLNNWVLTVIFTVLLTVLILKKRVLQRQRCWLFSGGTVRTAFCTRSVRSGSLLERRRWTEGSWHFFP